MSRAKAWRRAALATYIAAGAALTLAGYTVATTAANANTLRDTRERIEDFQREQTAIAENAIDRKKHTSELQSLMRISYAVFCLKQKQILSPPYYTSNNTLISTYPIQATTTQP